jgi:peptidoglycan/xylan/chitin deacetylase (PgdA/CDA1 family)
VRRRFLHAAQRALHASGASAAFVRASAGGGAMILVYHGIVDDEGAPWVDPRFSVPKSVFEEQMRFLAARRRVLSLDELVEKLSQKKPVARESVVITFDDGYRSTLDIAAPILKRLGLPAVLYLVTGSVTHGTSQFIDVLYASFNRRTRDVLDFEALGVHHADLRDPLVVRKTYLALADELMRASAAERDRFLAEIVDRLRPDGSLPRLTMTWDEVRELRALHPGIEIGLHTRNHVDLTCCGPDVVHWELRSCVEDVRGVLGVVARHFSFPYGRSSEAARRAVIEHGFRSAVVTEPAAVVRTSADPFGLARLSAPSDMSLFPFVTSGAYPELSLAVLGRA